MKKQSFRRQLLGSVLKGGVLSFLITAVVSFTVFVPALRKNAIASAESMNASVLSQVENTLSSAESYMENIMGVMEQSQDIQAYLSDPTVTNKTRACVMLNNLTSYMEKVRGIMFYSAAAPQIDSMTNFTERDRELLEEGYFKGAQTESFGRSWSPVYYAEVGSSRYCTVVYARSFYLNRQWCTILLFVNLNSMLRDVENMVGSALDTWYLTDSFDQSFYISGDEDGTEQADQALDENQVTNGRLTVDSDIVFRRKSALNDYGLVSIVRWESILAVMLPYTGGLFFAMLGFLILVMAIISRNINTLIQPVLELSRQMRRASDGNLDLRAPAVRQDEIGLLESSFNKMLDNLQRSITVIREKEAREQRIRFGLLVSQIDPHFIYNTINSINYLARKGRCDDIVTVNTALIAILRDRLRVNDIQITDTVENERHVVEQYLEIERFMYGGTLTVEWEVPKELTQEQIPKNMIQPLVENALFHGVIDEENGEFNGTIHIRIARSMSGSISLCVEDDGTGMDEKRLDEIRLMRFNPEERGKKIGLANIRGRLHYLYGNEEHMRIESEPGKGTRITITFPPRETFS